MKIKKGTKPNIPHDDLISRGFVHKSPDILGGYYNLYLKRNVAIQYVNVPFPEHPILLSMGEAFRIVNNAYSLEDIDSLIKLFR